VLADEAAGSKRAVILHTATGEHLRQLESLFQDVIEAETRDEEREVERSGA
jgi:hypothetical protein